MARPSRVPSRHERDLRDLVESEGYTFHAAKRTNGGHVRITFEHQGTRTFVITGLTPGDSRWRDNLRSDMKRMLRGRATR